MRFYGETIGLGRPVVFFLGAGWHGRTGLNICDGSRAEVPGRSHW